MSINKILTQDGYTNVSLEGRKNMPQIGSAGLSSTSGLINPNLIPTSKRPSPPKPIPSQNKNK